MKLKETLARRVREFARKELKPLLIMIFAMLAFRSAIADWNDVPTGSMKPTILEGDRVFVNKLAYDLKVPFTTRHLAEWDNPRRGDVVVFYSPVDGKRLVKRVAGLPGDTLELVKNQLRINGAPVGYAPLPEENIDELPAAERPRHGYAKEVLGVHTHPVMATPGLPARRDFGPLKVPDGKYFMMGDNRDNSFDSRYFGPVDRGEITGRATAVAMSFDPDRRYLPRWRRFLTALP